MKKLLLSLFVMAVLLGVDESDAQTKHPSKYAGQEKRAIKSLSRDDIRELRRGGGWGLGQGGGAQRRAGTGAFIGVEG